MPKRKERMAGYIRESDPSLADSTTIDSAAQAVREYAEREGYIYEPQHEYKEAISAYTVPYLEGDKLVALLEAAKRHEFDVVAVTEIRAISRRQVEVFIIYDMLMKYGIRLETIKEKFEDDAMGRLILGLRAAYAEIEKEQMHQRLVRGRKSRNEIGKAPNGHPRPAYGYVFVDTEREVKGAYTFDHTVVHTDVTGTKWTPYKVVLFIFTLLKQGTSEHQVARVLNELGIPTPQKVNRKGGNGHWHPGTIHTIVKNPIYIGLVAVNRTKKFRNPKTGKTNSMIRPQEEWQYLEGIAPALIDKETFEAIQKQLQINKEEAARNNTHPKEDYGLLRAGYIFCGVCGKRMTVAYPSTAATKTGTNPWYSCHQVRDVKPGFYRHNVQIHVPMVEQAVKEVIVEILQDPNWIRERVAELRKKPQPVINEEDIEATVATIDQQMRNLFNLAQYATTDQAIAELAQRMNDLEKQKRAAEAMLYDVEDQEEKQRALEAEIVRFENWVAVVRDDLANPSYESTYEDWRLAVRIIGIKVTVYPTKGDYPYRHTIDATVPEVMKKLYSDMSEGRALIRIASAWKSLNGPVPRCSAIRRRCAARGMAAVSVDRQKPP